MNHNELIDKITEEVMSKLNEKLKSQNFSMQQEIQKPNTNIKIPLDELAKYIDHTLLKPESTADQFDKLCNEAILYKFKSVCVNSSWVSYVSKKLRGSGVLVCSVVGFPLGGMDSRSKAFETRNAIESGANEIDMVINIGALKSGNLKLVEEDIRAVRRATRSNTVLKVILETNLLNEKEKILACEISKKAGANFVKTSTGFSGGGATIEDIILMRRIVGTEMGVKASGGIKEYNFAVDLINAGANRLGCGASVAVMTGAKATGNY